MLERINKNEERLDKILLSIEKLESALSEFESNKRDFYLLNKYYGSKNWFKDKEAYENNKIPKIKAGVLSEDAVWDIDDKIDDLILTMNDLVKAYSKYIKK